MLKEEQIEEFELNAILVPLISVEINSSKWVILNIFLLLRSPQSLTSRKVNQGDCKTIAFCFAYIDLHKMKCCIARGSNVYSGHVLDTQQVVL